MTALEQLIDICEQTCPGYEVNWGFMADVEQFLYENTVTRPVILVTVGPEVATEYDETGKAIAFDSSYGVILRTKTARRNDLGIYAEYRRLRDALNGYEIDTDEGIQTVQILSGENIAAKGIATAQLSMIVG